MKSPSVVLLVKNLSEQIIFLLPFLKSGKESQAKKAREEALN